MKKKIHFRPKTNFGWLLVWWLDLSDPDRSDFTTDLRHCVHSQLSALALNVVLLLLAELSQVLNMQVQVQYGYQVQVYRHSQVQVWYTKILPTIAKLDSASYFNTKY